MPFFSNLLFNFHCIFLFWLFLFQHTYRIPTYILCVTVCSVFMDFYQQDFFENSIKSQLCFVWFCEKATASSLDTSSNFYTLLCTLVKPLTHTLRKTQGTRFIFFLPFSFFFFWPCYPSVLLRNTSSMPQCSLGGSTCTSSGCTHVRRTLLNLANWSDSSTQWLRNRQSWQRKWAV